MIDQLQVENERLRQEVEEAQLRQRETLAWCEQLRGKNDALIAQLAATTDATLALHDIDAALHRELRVMTEQRDEWKTACALSEARVKELEARP